MRAGLQGLATEQLRELSFRVLSSAAAIGTYLKNNQKLLTFCCTEPALQYMLEQKVLNVILKQSMSENTKQFAASLICALVIRGLL